VRSSTKLRAKSYWWVTMQPHASEAGQAKSIQRMKARSRRR
jgi:hypothetical protein